MNQKFSLSSFLGDWALLFCGALGAPLCVFTAYKVPFSWGEAVVMAVLITGFLTLMFGLPKYGPYCIVPFGAGVLAYTYGGQISFVYTMGRFPAPYGNAIQGGPWQALLATSPVELFYLGQQPKEAVLAQMQELAEGLPERTALVQPTTRVECPRRPVQVVQETMDVTQGKLTLGLRTPITVHDPRYPALTLLNTVYGAGATSKLMEKIREEQSLCYYAGSSMDKFKGIMVVSSGIEFADYEVAKEGILHQLDLCRQGEITQQELESARSYLISALRTGNDSPGRLDDYAIGQAVAGLSGSMEDLAAQVQAVTMDQVVEAANTLTLDTVYFLKGVEA